MPSPSLPSLQLNPRADKRLRAGHQWVFSNEVDTTKTPLKNLVAGDQVVVHSAEGRALGVAIVNPNTLLCGRIISRDAKQTLDRALLVQRIGDALRLRERFFEAPFYRLVYGDSDFLSGLVIDRFDDVLAVQIGAAGMERVKPLIAEALVQCLSPRAIVWKNDGSLRDLEGLPSYVEAAVGAIPSHVRVRENGCEFEAPLADGQKTGWFYDHRDGRKLLLPWVRGKRVLDVFSYIGSWGVQAAVAGARAVTCVDSSAAALEAVVANATRNGVGDRVDTLKGNAFDVLAALASEGAKYDVVILDPPAFIKRRKDFGAGFKAYQKLNDVGMRLVENDGLLVSASCSMHLARADLVEAVRAAGRHVDRQVQIIAHGHQGIDHPVHPAIPETEYLKTLVGRVFW